MKYDRFTLILGCWAALLLVGSASWGIGHAAEPTSPSTDAPLKLQDQNRVTILGGAFVERMNDRGYFESVLLASHPEVSFTFRNLGWSGDNVWGDARAVFGNRADGFKRLVQDTLATKPTVVLICYGENEAYAGRTGLLEFRQGYEQLLTALAPSQARFVLVAPRRHESLGAPLPDAKAYNESLILYRDEIRKLAEEKGHAFVDLFDALSGPLNGQPAPLLTTNGVHLSGFGNWKLAEELVLRLTGRSLQKEVKIELPTKPATAGENLFFTQADSTLHLPTLADQSLPAPDTVRTEPRKLQVPGLAAGKYELLIDSKSVGSYSHAELSQGVSCVNPTAQQAADKLRELVLKKDELYFHRYRPQNETYLFLFRKHEQGNNAAEIPQFDPLVEQLDQAILTARKPVKYTVELKPVAE